MSTNIISEKYLKQKIIKEIVTQVKILGERLGFVKIKIKNVKKRKHRKKTEK